MRARPFRQEALAFTPLFLLGFVVAGTASYRFMAMHDKVATDAARCRGLLALLSEGAILLDRKGRFLYANAAATRLFHTPANELIGRALPSVVHPDERNGVAARLAEVPESDRALRVVTCRAQVPGDGWAWLELKFRYDPEAKAIVATCIDVTGVRQARESRASVPSAADPEWARRVVDRLWLAIEQTEDSVVITDREGVIEYVNPAFEGMSGFTREQAIGRTPNILRSGVQTLRFYENLWNTILAGRTFHATMTNRRKDGTLYDEDQTITPIRDPSGMVTHFVSTGRDITQRNRMQEALRRLNQKLEAEAGRIAGTLHDEAGQFLTTAHITLADVARDADPSARERLNEVRRHLDVVEERLRRVAHEIHPRVVEDLGLSEAVKFMADAFMRRTGIRVTVTTSIQNRYHFAIETLLYRVVQEGLTNVSRHANAASAEITLAGDDAQVACTIRDDGVGFDPAAVAAPPEGSLGLRVMQDRLDAVAGTLVIDSAPGKGTEVRARVPVEV
jgi:PAS domain S-box-containing protein